MSYSFLKAGLSPDNVLAEANQIPRLLWQTTRDKQALDPELQCCVDGLKAMNPTWRHRLFDDHSQLDFLEPVCSERFMRAYARIAPEYGAARADLFRYVVIFLYGGCLLYTSPSPRDS